MRPFRRSLAPVIVFAGVRLRDISATCIFNVIIDSLTLNRRGREKIQISSKSQMTVIAGYK
jgi:hypothetical protein